MTEEEFFDLLKKTPRDWYLDEEGQLRRAADEYGAEHCPISAVTGVQADFDFPLSTGAERLGLKDDIAELIFQAADNAEDEDDIEDVAAYKTMRNRLLEACGLGESAVEIELPIRRLELEDA